MSMSVGRPVSPTVLPPAQSQVKVAQPVVSEPSVQTASKPLNTQESFGAARQSVVGKTSETVNPSQGGQQIKQGIEQSDGEQLLEQGQTLMGSTVVKEEFGDGASALPKLSPPTPLPPPPPPPKVSSVSPKSGGSSITPDMLVQARQNLKPVSQHQVLNLEKADTTVTESSRSVVLKDEGSAFAPERLTAKSTLEIVGHGASDGSSIGGLNPKQLAQKLKQEGITQLAVLDLKSCYSEGFKTELEGALKEVGITVGEVKSYGGQIAISRETGKAMQGAELEQIGRHDGALGLLDGIDLDARIVAPLSHEKEAYDQALASKNVDEMLRSINTISKMLHDTDGHDQVLTLLRNAVADFKSIEADPTPLCGQVANVARESLERGQIPKTLEVAEILVQIDPDPKRANQEKARLLARAFDLSLGTNDFPNAMVILQHVATHPDKQFIADIAERVPVLIDKALGERKPIPAANAMVLLSKIHPDPDRQNAIVKRFMPDCIELMIRSERSDLVPQALKMLERSGAPADQIQEFQTRIAPKEARTESIGGTDSAKVRELAEAMKTRIQQARDIINSQRQLAALKGELTSGSDPVDSSLFDRVAHSVLLDKFPDGTFPPYQLSDAEKAQAKAKDDRLVRMEGLVTAQNTRLDAMKATLPPHYHAKVDDLKKSLLIKQNELMFRILQCEDPKTDAGVKALGKGLAGLVESIARVQDSVTLQLDDDLLSLPSGERIHLSKLPQEKLLDMIFNVSSPLNQAIGEIDPRGRDLSGLEKIETALERSISNLQILALAHHTQSDDFQEQIQVIQTKLADIQRTLKRPDNWTTNTDGDPTTTMANPYGNKHLCRSSLEQLTAAVRRGESPYEEGKYPVESDLKVIMGYELKASRLGLDYDQSGGRIFKFAEPVGYDGVDSMSCAIRVDGNHSHPYPEIPPQSPADNHYAAVMAAIDGKPNSIQAGDYKRLNEIVSYLLVIKAQPREFDLSSLDAKFGTGMAARINQMLEENLSA